MKGTKIKKIVINGRFLTQEMTGVQRYAHELVKAIDELIELNDKKFNNYKFELVFPPGSINNQLNIKNIKMRKAGMFSGHVWEQLILPFIAKDSILFCPGNTSPILSHLIWKNTFVTIHSLAYKYFPKAYSFGFKFLYNLVIPFSLKYAKQIFTVSNSEKKAIVHLYKNSENKINVIQNGGFGKEYFKEEKSDNSIDSGFEPFILFVGSLSKGKNLNVLLKALNYIADKEIKIVVAGASSRTFSESTYTKEIFDKNRVLFIGNIEDTNKMIQLYKSAEMLVVPSFYEASPLPPIEAMSCLCPVIAADTESLKERCGEAAIYFNPVDEKELSSKINELLSDDVKRKSLCENGLTQSGKYSWENCAEQTLKFLIT